VPPHASGRVYWIEIQNAHVGAAWLNGDDYRQTSARFPRLLCPELHCIVATLGGEVLRMDAKAGTRVATSKTGAPLRS
jgi:hypothetical protein